jgi:hypothetical protein
MQPTSKFRLGLRFGLITGVVYGLLLLLRYKFFATSPISFSICLLISYLVVLVLYLYAGISRKKELNGYANFKDIFQTIFITILITEAVYIVFNAIYLKYVDPGFFDNFKAITRDFLEKHGSTQDQIDRQMKGFEEGHQMMSPIELIKGYGTWVIIDSIIGMIYAAILRKKKDIFQEPKL